VKPSSVSIEEAEQLLRAGDVVALPTETVYGLGADATNDAAVQRVFALKGRPATNPLIVHVASIEAARRFVRWDERAAQLLSRFAPGPLSVVLKHRTDGPIVSAVRAGLDTVAIRIPSHPMMLGLLRRFDGPVAAPSANRSNRVSPTRAEHVQAELGDIPILDGGPCAVGLESTVVDLSSDTPRLLRPGAVTRDQIESVIGRVEVFAGHVVPATAAQSPGQQPIHYAPTKPAFRVEPGTTLPTDAAVIRFGADVQSDMRSFYARLRDADASGYSVIMIELPPERPEWAALRDRIERATQPLARGA
jgi:L-threonylcarbamoyladenylate synthase